MTSPIRKPPATRPDGHDPLAVAGRSPAGRRREIDLAAGLSRALHSAGSPAHVLEESMERVSARLGLEGQFFATPTSVFASFGAGADQQLVLERIEPSPVDLERLALLDGLIDSLVAGEVDAGSAEGRLDDIVSRAPRYGPALTTVAFAAASGSAARFFGGGWSEMAAAGLVGLLIGVMALGAGRRPTLGRLFEPLAAAAAAFVATALAAYPGPWAPVSPFVVTLAGLIVLIPGLTLTVAMRELATRHLVAGSARLAGAVVVFVTIAFGVAFGQRGARFLFGEPPAVDPAALSWTADAVALLITAAALTVLFRARPSDSPWVFLAGAVALAGGRAGGELVGAELGALLAALMVGLASNLFARLMRRPAAVMQVPALMLLVPGSVGFRSLASLLERQTVAGVQTGFSMLLVAVALVSGLLLANALLPPKRGF